MEHQRTDGVSINLDGHAAYKPEHTYAHPIAQAFASGIGFDGEGKNVSPDAPSAGPHATSVAPEFRSGAR